MSVSSSDQDPSGTDRPEQEPASRPVRRRRRRLPWWKKSLFALVVTVAFFGFLELLLAVIGVNPLTYTEDPFVGFTSRSPLFEEVQTQDGQTVYRTVEKKLSWFNSQEFPATKQQNDYRIFCLGGSTTYGRPYNDVTSFSGWLREYLPLADTGHQWQVVNAGGISYASYRVASLMEELIQYEPDLFIIYCGQNEFLERRTYSQLISTPRAIRETAAILGRSRIYTSVRSMLGRGGGSQTSSATSKLPEEVNAILDGSVGPDDYQRDEEQRDQTIAHYRFNLVRMIEIARSVGARVVMVNPAVNERNMSPFKSQHKDGLSEDNAARWTELVAQAAAHRDAGEPDEALTALQQALEIDSLYADTHFQLGEILYSLGRYEDAKQAFGRAIDEDVCPLRILSEMRPVVAETAAEYDVPLVDYQQLLDSRTETGITGEEWFLDHVHPTIEGYRELALSLMDALHDEGIVDYGSQWTDEARQQTDATVLAHVDDHAHGVALRNLAKVLSWARKYEEAGRLSQLAAEKLGDDAEAMCMAAYDFERRGDYEQAKEHYRRAIALRPDYDQAHYNLGHVHRRLEEWEQAAQSFQRAIDSNPQYPGAHYNLGLLFQKSNQLEQAARCFELSLGVNDQHPASWEELGITRLNQGRKEEAVRHLERAVSLDPNLASAYNSLGVAFAQMGQLRQAVQAFEKAVSTNPNFDAAQQNLKRARELVK